jgi:protoheme IX farnesyltransferase
LYRNNDYAKSGLPMLPVTHGKQFTRLHILLYSFSLFAASMLPFIVLMSGLFYLAAAAVLSGLFILYSWRLYKEYSDELARKLFRYSIVYLALLFAALLLDHWIALI